jgi:hypothetical protein
MDDALEFLGEFRVFRLKSLAVPAPGSEELDEPRKTLITSEYEAIEIGSSKLDHRRVCRVQGPTQTQQCNPPHGYRVTWHNQS